MLVLMENEENERRVLHDEIRMKTLQQETNGYSVELNTWEQKHQQEQASVEALQTRKQALDKEIQQKMVEEKQLKNRIENLKSQTAAAESKMTEISIKIKRCQSAKAELEQSFRLLNEKKAQIEGKKKNLDFANKNSLTNLVICF